MKYALFGDFHGSELNELEYALKYQNPDVLICTGDFDSTKTIRQFMNLEEKYKKKGKKVIKVPGNHDHAILTNKLIMSGTLARQGKSSIDLHNELKDDLIAFNYLRDLVNSGNLSSLLLDEQEFNDDYRAIVLHGALEGDLSSYPKCPEDLASLWLRLESNSDFKYNFDAMVRKGFNVMIRGHDHEKIYTYNDPEKGLVFYEPNENESTYRLLDYRQHVINPGALFHGDYAIIDTRSNVGEGFPILEYRIL
jgi:predicted phosphodiesterase